MWCFTNFPGDTITHTFTDVQISRALPWKCGFGEIRLGPGVGWFLFSFPVSLSLPFSAAPNCILIRSIRQVWET